MAHLDYAEAGAKREDKRRTPDAWLHVAADVARYARDLISRGDVVANVGPGIGGPYGTACWTPALADMDVNTDTCLPGYAPDKVDFLDPVFQLGIMPFVGAVTHESAHARWTPWVPLTLMERAKAGAEPWDKATIQVIVALEESRIETLMARACDKHQRDALAACALSIVLRDFKVDDTPFGASISAALTLARSALLNRSEIARFRALLLEHLSADTLDALAALWTEYHDLHPYEWDETVPEAYYAAMFSIAERWVNLVKDEAEGKGEPSGLPGDEGEGGEGVVITFCDADGAGTPSDDDEGEGGALDEALRKIAGDAAMEREAEDLDKRGEKLVERKIADKAADHERRDAAAEIHRKHAPESHGYSSFAASHKDDPRKPTGAERAAASRLGGMLARITWHDKAITKVMRVLPGGKLRPRAAVQKAADRARGGRAEVPIWKAKERHHTDDTPIRVGILTDVSGSMGHLSKPSAVLTYVLSNAVASIEGQVATAVFGNHGYLVNRARERADVVQEWYALDGTEAFREGALLLDKELNLLDSVGGARILVIFTDSHLVSWTDAEYAKTFMRLCKAKGVTVVWANYREEPDSNFGYGALVAVTGDAAEIATQIGKAIVAEVEKVENARGA
jgi:hypothetical protein